ncbi:MAG: GIY-YIG nuclease family protein [Phocaeicola sp.]
MFLYAYIFPSQCTDSLAARGKIYVKIGQTERFVSERVGEQFVTSNWEEPRIVWQMKVDGLTDKDLHEALSEYRVRHDREWFCFNCSTKNKQEISVKAAKVVENNVVHVVNRLIKERNKKKRQQEAIKKTVVKEKAFKHKVFTDNDEIEDFVNHPKRGQIRREWILKHQRELSERLK